jgi:aminomethyltransferase
MQYAITRDVRKLAVGQVVYSAMCYDNGCMVDDGTLFRLCENNFRWVGGSEDGGKLLRKIAKEKNLDVWVKSSTDQLHNVAVQGPKSRETLAKIIWTPRLQPDVEDLKWFRFSIGRIGGEFGIPVMVSRTGYSGELGYEVFAHPDDCEAVWDAIAEAGEEFNICPLGLNALDMLRIEAGLIFGGYEFCDQTDPFEAGIAFTVPLKTKEDDFSGKESLILRKNSPQRTLVGLELHNNEVALHGDGVYIGKQQVGIITSATRSPILKKNIALCRISVSESEIGTEVEVGKLDGHQKRLAATVVRFPFYDPEKTRVRM